MSEGTYRIIDASNGHRWIKPDWMGGKVCCLDCGILRRLDDTNKTCPGKVGISFRSADNGEKR